MTVQGVARRDVDVAGACTEEEGPDYAQRTRTRGDAAGTGALDLCTDWEQPRQCLGGTNDPKLLLEEAIGVGGMM